VNYAKGMFRLWMVVTGCWMAIAVSMHYDGEMQAYKFVGSEAPASNRTFEEVETAFRNADKAGDTAGAKALADEIRQMRATVNKETYCEYGPSECIAKNNTGIINPYDMTDFRNWEPDWARRLKVIFAYALAGPLMLLLICLAAAWIARGFRAAPNRPKSDST